MQFLMKGILSYFRHMAIYNIFKCYLVQMICCERKECMIIHDEPHVKIVLKVTTYPHSPMFNQSQSFVQLFEKFFKQRSIFQFKTRY